MCNIPNKEKACIPTYSSATLALHQHPESDGPAMLRHTVVQCERPT